jgi:putative transposase
VPADPYRGHRFPEEIISQCVWLYFNFCVSFRDVELMMAFRGVQVSYETIRRWCDKFGQSYAAKLKRRRAKLGDEWHLDEVFLKINGVQHYLWRAVDQHGAVIDILVQPRRDRYAAIRFFRKLLRTCGRRPRVMITDKLRSYGAARRVIMPSVAHRQHRYLNNRAENSHQPTRQRERRMKRFKSPEHSGLSGFSVHPQYSPLTCSPVPMRTSRFAEPISRLFESVRSFLFAIRQP